MIPKTDSKYAFNLKTNQTFQYSIFKIQLRS